MLLIPTTLIALVLSPFIILDTHWFPIYKQRRVGKHGRPFNIYKFRTMRRMKTGNVVHYDLTRFGKLLRELSLDELPQIFNVITGEMSFIGPRPLQDIYPSRFQDYSDYEKRIFLLTPGITGLAQLNDRKNISWANRIFYNQIYGFGISYYADFLIIVRTLRLIFRYDLLSR